MARTPEPPRTTARLDGGEWVINGAKSFITNSGTAITDLITVTAVTGERDGRKEISAIIVPAGTPGLTVSEKYSKVGWAASDTRGLFFDDVRVPAENLLGERGRGYAQFLAILDEGRVAIAALAVGLAQGCVDESVRYARERASFGRRIGEYQAVQFAIADMEARAHTARLAYYAAAARMLRGEPFKKEAAIAKLVASNAAMDNARAATQVFGGYGFMNEYPVGALLPRREGAGDRRGDLGDPADGHRPRAGAVELPCTVGQVTPRIGRAWERSRTARSTDAAASPRV